MSDNGGKANVSTYVLTAVTIGAAVWFGATGQEGAMWPILIGGVAFALVLNLHRLRSFKLSTGGVEVLVKEAREAAREAVATKREVQDLAVAMADLAYESSRYALFVDAPDKMGIRERLDLAFAAMKIEPARFAELRTKINDDIAGQRLARLTAAAFDFLPEAQRTAWNELAHGMYGAKRYDVDKLEAHLGAIADKPAVRSALENLRAFVEREYRPPLPR